MDNEFEERVLRALDIKVREPAMLPTKCGKCGLLIVLDFHSGEMWHTDHEVNLDHRPEYERYRGSMI